jgi:hypothetical protein
VTVEYRSMAFAILRITDTLNMIKVSNNKEGFNMSIIYLGGINK